MWGLGKLRSSNSTQHCSVSDFRLLTSNLRLPAEILYYCRVPQVFRVDFLCFLCVLSRIFFNTAPRSPKVGKNVDKSLLIIAVCENVKTTLLFLCCLNIMLFCNAKCTIRPYQINYLFIIPSLSNFWPKAKNLFIFCACARCALIRIKRCTN